MSMRDPAHPLMKDVEDNFAHPDLSAYIMHAAPPALGPICADTYMDPVVANLGDSDILNYMGPKSWLVYGGAEANSITTSNGGDTLFGGDGNDSIDAGNGDNQIDAGADNDTVSAGSGNDLIKLGSGTDQAWSWGGNDTIDGGSGNDYISGGNEAGDKAYYVGGSGNDTLAFSGQGSAKLDGGNGNDVFYYSATGHVTATGGLGADSFYFYSNNGSISAGITDFSPKEGDAIHLEATGTYSYDPKTGTTHFDAIGLEEISLTAGGDLALGKYGEIEMHLLGVHDLNELASTGALVLGSDATYGNDDKG